MKRNRPLYYATAVLLGILAIMATVAEAQTTGTSNVKLEVLLWDDVVSMMEAPTTSTVLGFPIPNPLPQHEGSYFLRKTVGDGQTTTITYSNHSTVYVSYPAYVVPEKQYNWVTAGTPFVLQWVYNVPYAVRFQVDWEDASTSHPTLAAYAVQYTRDDIVDWQTAKILSEHHTMYLISRVLNHGERYRFRVLGLDVSGQTIWMSGGAKATASMYYMLSVKL